MPSLRANPTDRPSREDEEFWAEEAEYFRFKPANPRAPQDSSDYRGWGIAKDKLPPGDALEYVIAHYMQDELGQHNHDSKSERYVGLHPMFKWSFISVCMAHFLWFRSKNGAKWLMRLYGVEERAPFSAGYAYFWVDGRPGGTGKADMIKEPVYRPDPHNPARQVLVDGVELRIFREWERDLAPPCSVENQQPLEEMKKLLLQYRNPYAAREIAFPDSKVFFWVSEVLRDWFLEAAPNRDWPTRKATRMSGFQWVKNLERAPNQPFYEGLAKVALFKGRAYRLQDASGGVYWCGGNEIRIIPRNDLYLEHKVMNDEQVDSMFRCQNCRKRKPCVPYTNENRRCCHCFAVELEQNDRPTLSMCTMDRECKRCPDVLQSHNELVTLTNRLNRPARTGPVPR